MIDTAKLQTIPDIMESIGPLYLCLLRENYLDREPGQSDIRHDLASLVSQICAAGKERLFHDLLGSQDWREILVGVYGTITLRAALFHPEDLPASAWNGSARPSSAETARLGPVADRLIEQLTALLVAGPIRPLVVRPICIALAAARNLAPIEAFLNARPVRSDGADDYAAALAGVQLLKRLSDEEIARTYADVVAAIRLEEWFDVDAFQESKRRCARALDYWAAGLSTAAGPVVASEVPIIRVQLLLGELAPSTQRIRKELPGWYPGRLLPRLQAILKKVANPQASLADLDIEAAHLAAALRERPETEAIANGLELALEAAIRAMPPRAELPAQFLLPGWLKNEIEVRTRKIIDGLPGPSELPAEPPMLGREASPGIGTQPVRVPEQEAKTLTKITTRAIVFTDIVGSTALNEELGDEQMNEVRKAHFEQARRLLSQHGGREINSTGDGLLAVFRSADAALDFAQALYPSTGHDRVKIRAGIHVGQVQVEKDTLSGGEVNFAARVVGAIEGAAIWLSDRAKHDIDQLRAHKHDRLQWKQHVERTLKGFAGTFTLWELTNPIDTQE